jgi:serine/threonine-protein kinase HipA
MKKIEAKNIYVYAHWEVMKEPILMGVLGVDYIRGKETFSFEYDKNWLQSSYQQIVPLMV